MLFKIFFGIGILIGFGQALINKDGSLLAGMTLTLILFMVIQYLKISGKKTVLSFIKNRVILTLLVITMLIITLATPIQKQHIKLEQSVKAK
ncbi:hypothetical protein [Methylomonas methanica]|uniref:hypothetical protein n=1 Tax=Methylomonas methanica TaxID=421 RepID=UPI00059C77FE|nr:hypothetical protein [Methylomonas methanica]